MNAHQSLTQADGDRSGTGMDERGMPPLSISALLGMQARMRPEQSWLSDRTETKRYSFKSGHAAVAKLAHFFESLRLKPGSRIGLLMPASPQTILTIMAAWRAGMTPVMMSPIESFHDLFSHTEGSGVVALIAGPDLAGLDLATQAVKLAAAAMSVRFVAAFGETIPEGVIRLNGLLEQPDLDPSLQDDSSLMQMQEDILLASGQGMVMRKGTTIAASGLRMVTAARIGAYDRIVMPCLLDDAASLAVALASPLYAGAGISFLDNPSASAALEICARHLEPTHLIWPACLEQRLGSNLPKLASLILLHHAPFEREPSRPLHEARVVDLVNLREFAATALERDPNGAFSLKTLLEGAFTTKDDPIFSITMRSDGRLMARGGALDMPRTAIDGWHDLGLRVFADWQDDILAMEIAPWLEPPS